MKIIKKWTEKELALITEEYPVNPRVHDLFPDRSYQSVSYKAWELGLKAAGRGHRGVNYRYFDVLNSNSSYVLGFIAADGNIGKNILTITQSDPSILNQIASDMDIDAPHPIFSTSTGGYNMVIRNEYLVNRLTELGIMERKSLRLGKMRVPDRYLHDFARGYIDGDGCVCVYPDHRRGSHNLEVSVLGTYNFLHWLQAYIHRTTGLPKRKVRDCVSSRAKTMKYYGRNAVLLLTWMYKDNPELLLQRKRDVFDRYLNIYPDRRTYSYNMPCPGSANILLGEDIVQGNLH